MCNNESKYLVENVQYKVSFNTLLKLPTDLSNHPFNPVIVIPWTKYFDRKRYNTSKGRHETTLMANCSGYGV